MSLPLFEIRKGILLQLKLKYSTSLTRIYRTYGLLPWSDIHCLLLPPVSGHADFHSMPRTAPACFCFRPVHFSWPRTYLPSDLCITSSFSLISSQISSPQSSLLWAPHLKESQLHHCSSPLPFLHLCLSTDHQYLKLILFTNLLTHLLLLLYCLFSPARM